MFGTSSDVNSLGARKQLLVAESDLNRAQLLQEWQTITGEVRSIADQARSISCVASATASLVAGLASLRHRRPVPPNAKPTWWQTLLKGAQLAGSLWSEFRPQGRAQNDK